MDGLRVLEARQQLFVCFPPPLFLFVFFYVMFFPAREPYYGMARLGFWLDPQNDGFP